MEQLNPYRIAVITGSRAEYELLYGLMKRIEELPQLRLQLIVTGMHLSPEFGMTVDRIIEDGFAIEQRVEMLVSSDTGAGAAKSTALGMIGFADAFARLRPHWVVVLGDRYEIWAAASAAYLARIPIAHIGGGDVTEGALDEAIRHGITKMAQLHFVTNEQSARRVRRLGEAADTIIQVGHPGIDRIMELPLLPRQELERELEFTFRLRNVLVTYHPATLGEHDAEVELKALLTALDSLGDEVGILLTKPNADPGGRRYGALVEQFASNRRNCRVYTSLGQLRYFSAARVVDAVVGNSSSGLCEIPSLGTPTVDIGVRQRGRLRGPSVLHCEPNETAIRAAILHAFRMDASRLSNPYGNGTSSVRMVEELCRRAGCGLSGLKRFC
ncbi:UDP-N-acetylglucosamine 2-epimerase [Paenibacillus sp. SYP-B4298]|uniref:UDP-N-acetylglucosamine 2-epimerase n=1 Tax=Paenibacillus sp. SYP-B4298 TaxID=2996034 RepID=UPI0022DD3C7F|nr:UDP-N-acetylglucosamine 2-epimerase [Paenibacillus sp. SYP-B4298]